MCKYSSFLVKNVLFAHIVFSEPHHNSVVCLQSGPLEQLQCVSGRGGARHFHLGGPLEGLVLQQEELSMVCVGLSERVLKIFWGPLGGQAKFWGGSGPP